jgi:AIR synthase-related protein
LRASEAFRNKCRIAPVAEIFNTLSQSFGIKNGDDAAVIPQGDEYLLLAAEGIQADLVRQSPRFAGKCAVLANINDIYAMGGRPLALVDVVGAPDEEHSLEICRGIRDSALRYQTPVVGGHLLRTSQDYSLSLAVLGRAKRCITSFDAHPGDHLLLLRRSRGVKISVHGFWNCTLPEDDATLIHDLELLPYCAEQGLLRAGKDISMAGISGTALMLAEASGIGLNLDLDNIAVPDGYTLAEWLLAFMSYGFLLAAHPDSLETLIALFRTPGLYSAVIGRFNAQDQVRLCLGSEEHILWDFAKESFAGARA